MAGLKGFQRHPGDDARIRRNFAAMAHAFSRNLGDGIGIVNGNISIALFDPSGLQIVAPVPPDKIARLSVLVSAPLTLDSTGGVMLDFGDGLELDGNDALAVETQDPIFVNGDGVGLTLRADPGLQIDSGLGVLLDTNPALALGSGGLSVLRRAAGSGLLQDGPGLYVDNTVYVPYAGATGTLQMGDHSVRADRFTVTFPFDRPSDALASHYYFDDSSTFMYWLDFGDVFTGGIRNCMSITPTFAFAGNIGTATIPFGNIQCGSVTVRASGSADFAHLTRRSDSVGEAILDIQSPSGIQYRSAAADVNLKLMITSLGGIAVRLINRTGAATVTGTVVKADPNNNDSVILTDPSDDEAIGVFRRGGDANNAATWVVVAGIADVQFEQGHSPVRGDWVGTSTTASGRATSTTSPPDSPRHFDELGHCIQSVTAEPTDSVLARCVLHFN